MSESFVRLQAIVSGHVQGVNFRYYTRERAEALALTGWVKNLLSGEVEVVAEGPRPAVEKLLAFLQRGPSLAKVKQVQAQWAAASGEFKRFEVRM